VVSQRELYRAVDIAYAAAACLPYVASVAARGANAAAYVAAASDSYDDEYFAYTSAACTIIAIAAATGARGHTDVWVAARTAAQASCADIVRRHVPQAPAP
jgi:hypothetical protein